MVYLIWGVNLLQGRGVPAPRGIPGPGGVPGWGDLIPGVVYLVWGVYLVRGCTWSEGGVYLVPGAVPDLGGGWSRNTVPIASTQVTIKGIVQYSTRADTQPVGQSDSWQLDTVGSTRSA